MMIKFVEAVKQPLRSHSDLEAMADLAISCLLQAVSAHSLARDCAGQPARTRLRLRLVCDSRAA